MKRGLMQRLFAIFLSIVLFGSPGISIAATGCNFPTSLDAWANKATGDFLTVADVNQHTCAIEQLEIALNTSAGLRAAITDETGTGALVFATSPTLSGTIAGTYTLGGTPTLGVNLAASGAPNLATTAARLGAVNATSLNASSNILAGGESDTGLAPGEIRTVGPFTLRDGITAPAATAGVAKIFVDTVDGDLKIIFGDGTTKLIVSDT